ncbi:MAG: FkbM family methyltransferase [Verrucomicrobiota bacterium]
MTNQIRALARRFLPPFIRKPLGVVCGQIVDKIFRPLMGLTFDLLGGRFRAGGCVFVIPKKLTRLSFRACFLTNDYEVDERKLIPKYLRPTDTVLEFGACLGVVSCLTNKLLREPNRHVVVEGNPFCLPAIHRNRQLNQCGFLIESCAVTTQKQVTFSLHPKYITGGSLQNQEGIPVLMPGRSLKELNERYGPFSVLIMDIEGGELEVFETSAETLRNFRMVIVELHEWTLGKEGVERCRELLRQMGFQMTEQSFITEVWVNPKFSA